MIVKGKYRCPETTMSRGERVHCRRHSGHDVLQHARPPQHVAVRSDGQVVTWSVQMHHDPELEVK